MKSHGEAKIWKSGNQESTKGIGEAFGGKPKKRFGMVE
jgi:hypothetical protein